VSFAIGFNFSEIKGSLGLRQRRGAGRQTGQEPLVINLMKRLAKDEAGVTAIEYGLIAAGIGVAIITVVNTAGGSLASVFTSVNNDLATAAK
jgi:pilus assembly protein Flp/PilA